MSIQLWKMKRARKKKRGRWSNKEKTQTMILIRRLYLHALISKLGAGVYTKVETACQNAYKKASFCQFNFGIFERTIRSHVDTVLRQHAYVRQSPHFSLLNEKLIYSHQKLQYYQYSEKVKIKSMIMSRSTALHSAHIKAIN